MSTPDENTYNTRQDHATSSEDHIQDTSQDHASAAGDHIPYTSQDHASSLDQDEDEYFPQLSFLYPDQDLTPFDDVYPSIDDLSGWAPQDSAPCPSTRREAQDNVIEGSSGYQFLPYNTPDSLPGSRSQLPLAPQEIVGTGGATGLSAASTEYNVVAATPVKQEQKSDESDETARSSSNAQMASTRRLRARKSWMLSGPIQSVPENYSFGDDIQTMPKGRDSGCNMLARFGDDDTPRLKYNLMIRNPKDDKAEKAQKYPDPTKIHIPARTSLKKICKNYPRHVWGTGLRIFGSERWEAKQIYDNFPEDFRHKGAKTRQWNYLQAALGRELDNMEKEEGTPRVPEKRGGKRKAGASDDDDEEENTAAPAPKKLRRVKVESPARASLMRVPVMQPMTMQPPTTVPRMVMQLPSMRPQTVGGPPLHQPPQRMPQVAVMTQPATGSLNAPLMRPNAMAVQPNLQQLPNLCQDERQCHMQILYSMNANERVGFLESEQPIKTFIVQQMWQNRFHQFVNTIRVQYQHRTGNEVSGLDDVVNMLNDILRSLQADRAPEVLRWEAWMWMWLELRRWTAEFVARQAAHGV